MNNDNFLKRFKKALNSMASAEREEIIQEITTYADDANASLYERLGEPEELAKQYLDGEPPKLPLAKKALRIGKKVLVFCGLAFALIILILVLFIWWISKDAFDYANLEAKELNTNTASWSQTTVNGPLSISIKRSKVTLYWSDSNDLKWNCKSRAEITVENNTLDLQESQCLVFLPKQAHQINAEQTTLVVVEPLANIDMDIKQTTLKFADNERRYNYAISGSRMTVSDKLASTEGANIKLSIKALESTIGVYEY